MTAPTSTDPITFGFVVEGQGEEQAFPLLVRRICQELHGFHAIKTTRPVRITRSRLIRPADLEKGIRLAQEICHTNGRVLVLLDADDDCPAERGPQLRARANQIPGASAVSIT